MQINWIGPRLIKNFGFQQFLSSLLWFFGRWTVEGQHFRETLVGKKHLNWVKNSSLTLLLAKFWVAKVTYTQTNWRLRSQIELNVNQDFFGSFCRYKTLLVDNRPFFCKFFDVYRPLDAKNKLSNKPTSRRPPERRCSRIIVELPHSPSFVSPPFGSQIVK